MPKSISRQLLDTLKNWQPVDSKWTIKQLFERVTISVTDFLKIPMLEMNSEEFYSLYMDADNQKLGVYKPLPVPPKEENDELEDEDSNLVLPSEDANSVSDEQQEKTATD